tara:strand:+ start:606 stop:1004 length:399 start_codon:yes stop_codon:yes gene_type:complete
VAYPTGSGSEIIRRGAIHNQVTADTNFRFDGVSPTTGTTSGSGYSVATNHIITILSIIIMDQSNSSKTFRLYGLFGGSSVGIIFLQNVPVGPYETYVWNERLVLHPTDRLVFNGLASANFDLYYTYIDQDWT